MIHKAAQIAAPKFPRPKLPRQRAGLAYQRQVAKAFAASAPSGILVHPDTWYSYQAEVNGKWSMCSPDVLLFDAENGFIVAVEVKTTYTPLALEKLQRVYCPVVSRATGLPVTPLVVCKHLIPQCPRPSPTISFALLSGKPLFQWLGKGPILW